MLCSNRIAVHSESGPFSPSGIGFRFPVPIDSGIENAPAYIGLLQKGDYLGHQAPIQNGIRILMSCAIDAAAFRLLDVGRHADDHRRIEPAGQAGLDRHVTAMRRLRRLETKAAPVCWQNSKQRRFLPGSG